MTRCRRARLRSHLSRVLRDGAVARAGVPCQERKRIIKFGHKLKTGWTYEGKKEGNWRAWRDPGFSRQAWAKGGE